MWALNDHLPWGLQSLISQVTGFMGWTQPLNRPKSWCDLTRRSIQLVERSVFKGEPTQSGLAYELSHLVCEPMRWALMVPCGWTMAWARWFVRRVESDMCHGTELEWPWCKSWDHGPYCWAHDYWPIALGCNVELTTVGHHIELVGLMMWHEANLTFSRVKRSIQFFSKIVYIFT